MRIDLCNCYNKEFLYIRIAGTPVNDASMKQCMRRNRVAFGSQSISFCLLFHKYSLAEGWNKNSPLALEILRAL